DGLMALFFFLVGLEVKREVLDGQLASWKQASLPLFAAIGGMAAPALVFLWINAGSPENASGWAIPAATDIAFALGVLALMGNRVPVALKALLLAIAVIDDIGAIAIIAIFYSENIQPGMLIGAGAVLAVMMALGRAGVARNWPYVLLGIILWVLVLKSGVHATLAGVAAAMAIPMTAGTERPLERMEHGLHPWVAFFIVPVFALANAGVSLAGLEMSDLLAPLPLGIALGLVLGKQLGILGLSWIAVKAGMASLPDDVNWRQLHGLSLVAGIGFTMSLFIGALAFADPAQMDAVKLGVLSGSLVSALAGVALLWFGKDQTQIGSAAETEQNA
ncbi:MAG: Na+/H+ antiporter NhaA, partial [Sphingomonadaceae bacterium]|nr:Na+/H+ antiporter NhaA [Sphingomonadaceae bacterium]